MHGLVGDVNPELKLLFSVVSASAEMNCLSSCGSGAALQFDSNRAGGFAAYQVLGHDSFNARVVKRCSTVLAVLATEVEFRNDRFNGLLEGFGGLQTHFAAVVGFLEVFTTSFTVNFDIKSL